MSMGKNLNLIFRMALAFLVAIALTMLQWVMVLTSCTPTLPDTQPYAEVGPIFIHSKDCQNLDNLSQVPKMFSARNQMIIRGYDVRNRIVEDTGQLIETKNIQVAAKYLFKNIEISYQHVRSASNNCFQCRIEWE